MKGCGNSEMSKSCSQPSRGFLSRLIDAIKGCRFRMMKKFQKWQWWWLHNGWNFLMSVHYALKKIAKMVNFMVCIFTTKKGKEQTHSSPSSLRGRISRNKSTGTNTIPQGRGEHEKSVCGVFPLRCRQVSVDGKDSARGCTTQVTHSWGAQSES